MSNTSRGLARLLTLLAIGFVVAFAAGCGDDDDNGGGGGGTSGQPAEKETIKVGMVTDIGGLNDRSFNQLAHAGLKRGEKDLGAQIRVLTSQRNADYVPNLSTLAQQRYDLVIGVGFLMAEAMNTVAKRFPNVNFAIVDFSQAGLKDKPTNVHGLLFKEQEAGYLAGYLSGLYLEDKGGSKPVASTVGGQKIPPVDHYIAGFQAGIKAANPKAETLNGYSQDFVDQAKCKEEALNQIGEGSTIVFQVAGQCGLGALDAAREKGVQGIGVDADQAYLGNQVLTSAIKKVDVAVFTAIKARQDGAFKGGQDTIFDVKSGGVGLGKISSEGSEFADQVKEVQDKIAAGEIADIPDTVK